MKAIFAFCLLGFVSLICGCQEKQTSDALLRTNLVGTWKVAGIEPDGSADTHGTLNVSLDGTFRSELVTTVSNEMRPVTLQGYVQIQDGFLIETVTNAVSHWLPEEKRGALPPGGATTRSKIIRLDEHELVVETKFGRDVYTRIRQ
ncbi:MAG: hypothetical protein ACK4UN_17635 [Limisphaerales bacterium]